MAEQLTPAQALAVKNRGGRLLVSAAAGSGKTKVLVDRLMTYLTDPNDPAQLDEFLVITYTRAAAGELRAKIAKKLTERIAQDPENSHLQKQLQRLYLTKISTVHGFCGDLLREYAASDTSRSTLLSTKPRLEPILLVITAPSSTFSHSELTIVGTLVFAAILKLRLYAFLPFRTPHMEKSSEQAATEQNGVP